MSPTHRTATSHGHGKPRDIQWTWQSQDTDVRTAYMAVDGRITLADLIAHLTKVAPGVQPDDIGLNWATVTWTRPATGDELAARQQWADKQAARHEAWERETYTRLAAKYGTGT